MRLIRFIVVAGCAAVVGLSVGTPSGGAYQQDTAGPFTAVARADGYRITVASTNLIFSEIADQSGPSGQAFLDSLGQSVGFAGFPYPGETATAAPGLVAAFAPRPLPVLPTYPLAVRSQHPGSPEAGVTQGPLSLHATSSEDASTGEATLAPASSATMAVGTAVGRAAVHVDASGTIVADATASADSVLIADVLEIGSVEAGAHAELAVGGAPQTSSSFSASGVAVAGVPVTVSDEGILVAESPVPIPGVDPVAPVLAAAGITDLSYVAATEEGGIAQSAGLRVTAQQTLPSGNEVTVTWSFGFARADVSATATTTTDTAAQPPAAGGSSPVGDRLVEPVSHPVQTAPDADDGGVPDRAVPAAAAVGSQPAARTRLDTTSLVMPYLVLVVGGAVALGGSFAVRRFGVRLAWTS